MIINQPTYSCRAAARTLFADTKLLAWQVANGCAGVVYYFADGTTVVVDDKLNVRKYRLPVDHDVTVVNVIGDNVLLVGVDAGGQLAVSVSSGYATPTRVDVPKILWTDVVGVDGLDVPMTVFHKTTTGVDVLLVMATAAVKQFIDPTPANIVAAVEARSGIRGCTEADVVVNELTMYANFTPVEVVAKWYNRTVVLKSTATGLTVTEAGGTLVTELSYAVDHWFTCQDPTLGLGEHDTSAVVVVNSGTSAWVYTHDDRWVSVDADWLDATKVTAAVVRGKLSEEIVADVTSCVELGGMYLVTVADDALTHGMLTTGSGVTSLKSVVGGYEAHVYAEAGDELVFVNKRGVVQLPSGSCVPVDGEAVRRPRVVRHDTTSTTAVSLNSDLSDGSSIVEVLTIDGSGKAVLSHPLVLPTGVTYVDIAEYGAGYAVVYSTGVADQAMLKVVDQNWRETSLATVKLPTTGFRIVANGNELAAAYVADGVIHVDWLTSSRSEVVAQSVLTWIGVVDNLVYVVTPVGASMLGEKVVHFPGMKLLTMVDDNLVGVGSTVTVYSPTFSVNSTFPLFNCTPLVLRRLNGVYVLVYAVNGVVKCTSAPTLRFVNPDVEYQLT